MSNVVPTTNPSQPQTSFWQDFRTGVVNTINYGAGLAVSAVMLPVTAINYGRYYVTKWSGDYLAAAKIYKDNLHGEDAHIAYLAEQHLINQFGNGAVDYNAIDAAQTNTLRNILNTLDNKALNEFPNLKKAKSSLSNLKANNQVSLFDNKNDIMVAYGASSYANLTNPTTSANISTFS